MAGYMYGARLLRKFVTLLAPRGAAHCANSLVSQLGAGSQFSCDDARRAEMIRCHALDWCCEMWLACIILAIEVTRVMVGRVVLLDAGH